MTDRSLSARKPVTGKPSSAMHLPDTVWRESNWAFLPSKGPRAEASSVAFPTNGFSCTKTKRAHPTLASLACLRHVEGLRPQFWYRESAVKVLGVRRSVPLAHGCAKRNVPDARVWEKSPLGWVRVGLDVL